MKPLLFIFCILISCGTVDKKDPPHDSTIEDVKIHLAALKTVALNHVDENGWLAIDCDGMLWNGKYGAASGLGDIRASEFSDSIGRYGRTPTKRCWDGKDNGSKATWSRDMGVGLILWAYRSNNLSALQDHANFGVANQWKMGEPFADGRVLYTPAIIGLLYNSIYALGGKSNANRFWPTLWPSGLDDYQAHLQVLQIALQGEIAEELNEADAMPQKPLDGSELKLLSISSQMYERLEEHAKREPNCPTFQAVYAKYSGDYGPAINACVNQGTCTYVRGENAQLAELIFACDFIERQYK